jgi:hypothetical protein
VLTERGRDLYPVLVSLIQFGKLLQGESSTMELVHDGCGAPVVAQVRCRAGHDVSLADANVQITKR